MQFFHNQLRSVIPKMENAGGVSKIALIIHYAQWGAGSGANLND